jgi:predicted transcriptional regulator of viral defense system
MIEELRQKVPIEEFDYLMLIDALKDYKKPRDKITQLLKTGMILRIKKGIYVFGSKYRKGPVSLEVLANQIYGPSYISLEYALSYYNLIPERVDWVTSITSQKSKSFETPIGNFSYRHIHSDKYIVGVNNVQLDTHRFCMIASPEKAIADILAPMTDLPDKASVKEYLMDALQIEPHELFRLDIHKVDTISDLYRNLRVNHFLQVLKDFQ